MGISHITIAKQNKTQQTQIKYHFSFKLINTRANKHTSTINNSLIFTKQKQLSDTKKNIKLLIKYIYKNGFHQSKASVDDQNLFPHHA